MRPRLDALTIPEDSSRYFELDLDDWRAGQIAGARAEIAQLEELDELKTSQRVRLNLLQSAIKTLEGVPLRGAHHFRFPGFARAMAIQTWFYDNLGNDPGNALYAGALIGAFWSHRALELDASFPLRGTVEEIDAFAESVLEELQEHGYTWREILAMQGACDRRFGEWVDGTIAQAKEASDFSSGEEAT